ncbi:MAG: DNA gyrase inhibitor YacG [Luteitalea sp.]
MHPDWQPFCSERCRLLDLGHWLDGDYRVDGPADTEPPDTDPDDPGDHDD